MAASTQVYFSPGNLVAKLATASTSNGASWRFATRQYDIVGPASGQTMRLSAGDSLDVFYYSIANQHFGIFSGPSETATAEELNSFVDWGRMNTIAYRSQSAYAVPGEYRTPTENELHYLLNQRAGSEAGRIGDRADCRYAAANVEGVYGLMLFPNGFQWIRSTMGEYPKCINTYAAPDNSAYFGTQWAALEDAGVVFIPAAGMRDGLTLTYAGTSGSYLTTPSSKVHFTFKDHVLRDAGALVLNAMRFSTFDYGMDTYNRASVGCVRLVKDFSLPRTVIHISINDDNPYQMDLETEGKLQALVTYNDGTSQLEDIVRLLPTERIPTTGFDQRIISISGNKVTPLSYGCCIVYAESQGVESKPIVVGVRDRITDPSNENYGKSYFHLADGTRVLFAPGNLRAYLASNNATSASYWDFSPNQTVVTAPKLYTTGMTYSATQAIWGGFSAGYTEHFSYSDNKSSYGLRVEWVGGYDSTNNSGSNWGYYEPHQFQEDGFIDWGGLQIRMPGSTNTYYSRGYWKTPSYENWTDLLDRSRDVRVDGKTIRQPLEAEIYVINGNTCTILVPEGQLVKLPENVGQNITTAQWNDLQALGCVALPHAGMVKQDAKRRWGNNHAVNDEGYYWSSSYDFEQPAFVSPYPENMAYMTYLAPTLNYWYYDGTGGWKSNMANDGGYYGQQFKGLNLPNPANASTFRNTPASVRLIHCFDQAPRP